MQSTDDDIGVLAKEERVNALIGRRKAQSVGAQELRNAYTYIVGSKKLAVSRIVQEKRLESQDLSNSRFGEWCKGVKLEFVKLIFVDEALEDVIKSVQDFDPRMEIGARPHPHRDVSQVFGYFILREVYDGINDLRKLRVLPGIEQSFVELAHGIAPNVNEHTRSVDFLPCLWIFIAAFDQTPAVAG